MDSFKSLDISYLWKGCPDGEEAQGDFWKTGYISWFGYYYMGTLNLWSFFELYTYYLCIFFCMTVILQ